MSTAAKSTAKIKTTCAKCAGTGRYDAPTCYPGGCFACKGLGYFLTDPKTIARREARERKAEANAAARRIEWEAMVAVLMAVFEGEFLHIDAEYRHHHVIQKARLILAREHGISIRPQDGDIAIRPHLSLLGIAA